MIVHHASVDGRPDPASVLHIMPPVRFPVVCPKATREGCFHIACLAFLRLSRMSCLHCNEIVAVGERYHVLQRDADLTPTVLAHETCEALRRQ